MKIRYGLVLILALGFGLTGCASGGGSASGGGMTATPAVPGAETLAQGERPRQNAETRAAQRALDEASSAEDDAQAETLYSQALTSAEAAIAADSTNPLPWRQAAEANLGLGKYSEADRFMTRAEELRPIYKFETESIRERAWIERYQVAAPLVNQGQYEEAVRIFEQANAIYDQRPEVMITLGQLYAQLREHDKALENLDRATEIINSDKAMEMDSATIASWRAQAEDIPLTRAQVLYDAGRMEEAVEAFRQLSMDRPDDLVLRRNLATVLVQTGHEAEAFEVYDELMQMPGLSASDYYAIGVGYYQGSAYERSADAFGMAAEASPMDRDALEMWARSLQIDSVYAEVPPVGDRWIELDPNNQNAYLIMAQAVNQLGDEDRAREMVQAIEALPVTVDNLQLQRYSTGGGQVSGSLTNKTMDPGSSVTLDFTFYNEAGAEIGNASTTVTLGDQGLAELFQLSFDSSEYVGGYGYDPIGGM